MEEVFLRVIHLGEEALDQPMKRKMSLHRSPSFGMPKQDFDDF